MADAHVPFNNFANTGDDPISPAVNGLFTQYGKYYPLPQIDSVAGGNNYFYNSGTSINTDQGDFRLDYNISDKDHAFFALFAGASAEPGLHRLHFLRRRSRSGRRSTDEECGRDLDPRLQSQPVERGSAWL